MEVSSPQVPPIRPFILGQNTPIRSLFRRKTSPTNDPLDIQAAAQIVSNQQNLPVLPTTINEDDSSASKTPMDIADVSTAKLNLLPKTTTNPYSKQGNIRKDTTSTVATQNIDEQNCTNNSNTLPSSSIYSTTTDNSINTIPSATTTDSKVTEFQELSQDDLRLVEQAIDDHEKDTWTEVPHKSTKVPQTPTPKVTKPIDTNPYSPLRSDDEDSQKTNQPRHDSSTSITSTINIDKPMITVHENTKPTRSTPSVLVSKPAPTKLKQYPTTRNNMTAGRGGGKVTRDSQTNLTNALTTIATTNASPLPPTAQTEEMEIDEPNPGKPTPTQGKPPSTTGKPPPPHTGTPPPHNGTPSPHNGTPPSGGNTSSLRRAANQPLKYEYKIYVRAYPNEKVTEPFTRINIIQIVLLAFQAGETNTKIVLPADDTHTQRTYSTIKSFSKRKQPCKNYSLFIPD
jgi:hypothetical protein